MKSLIPLLFILLSCTSKPLSQSSEVKTKENEMNESCICFEIYQPVCGKDGKTYANSCEADCKKVKYKAGSCLEN